MPEELDIRESKRDDWNAIESLYPDAFPDEDLLPLVRSLLSDTAIATSLIGTIDAQIVGHAIFTKCAVGGNRVNTALLGPIAIASARQKQGVGSAIIHTGLRRLEDEHVRHVYVLGDPAYYRRLGFLPECMVTPPFPLPAEYDGAWQSQSLGDNAAPIAGKLSVPPQWRQRALWIP